MMSLRLRIFSWPGYLVFRLVMTGIRLLTLEQGFALGSKLGQLGWRMAPGARRLVRCNLQIAFGRERTAAELDSLAREHFRLMGANLFACMKVATMTPEEIATRVEVEIPETVQERRQREHRGFVAMISHQSNWELFAHLTYLLPEYPIGAVYQPLQNPWIDSYLRTARSRQGIRFFSRRDGFLSPIEFVRKGGCLAVLVDQHAGDGGVWTPLFDCLASTSPLAATLTLRAGTALLPVAIQTVGVARWKIVISEPLDPLIGEDSEEMTARVNQQLEKQVRKSPSDWFWLHDRWKLPHPNFLLSNYARGTAFPSGYDMQQLQPFRLLVCARDFAAAPAIRALRGSRPDLVLTLAVPAENFASWRVLVPQTNLIALEPKTLNGSLYDAVVLMDESADLARAIHALGVARLVGFNLPKLRPYLQQRVKFRNHKTRRQHFLDMASEIGATIPSEDYKPLPQWAEIGVTPWDYSQAKRVFSWFDLPQHLEKKMNPVPSADGALVVNATGAGIYLGGIAFPSEHRIFVRVDLEVFADGILMIHYDTDLKPGFAEARKMMRVFLTGRSMDIIELPSRDLAGRLYLAIEGGPVAFTLHNLEIRSLVIEPPSAPTSQNERNVSPAESAGI